MAEHSLEKELFDADDRAIEIARSGNQLGAFQLAKEVAARAKAEGLLLPYFYAQFRLMKTGRDLFDTEACKDASLRALALLESPEAAAAFQPGYDERKYGRFQRWLTPCSYDHLAVATALSNGYNSPGVHRCVAEGIDVCNRVGKPECISCFRSYAVKVFRAADDLDMALFNARRNMRSKPKDENDSDTRFVGAIATFGLELMLGRASVAASALAEAVQLEPVYWDKRAGKHDLALGARELAALLRSGEGAPAQDSLGLDLAALAADAPLAVPEHENPEEAYERVLVESLECAVAGDPAGSEAALSPWDDRLRRDGLLACWFEVRLRRVGLAIMMSDGAKERALSSELEKAALGADDHLTLRRLRGLSGLSGAALAMAAVGPIQWGSAGPTEVGGAPVEADTDGSAAAQAPSGEPEATPQEAPAYAERIEAFLVELEGAREAAGADDGEAAFPDVLKWLEDEGAREDQAPGSELLGAASRMLRHVPMDEERASGLWDWARSVAASVPDDGVALSRAAEIGGALVDRETPLLQDRLSSEAIDRLFERAMALAPDEDEPFGRAGLRHVRRNHPEKAERPLARSARLNRYQVSVVISLAGIYEESGRAGDALELIDLSIRDGCDEPELLWEGALLAPTLGRDQLALSYLDRYGEQRPDAPWVNYYRAKALLALGRFDGVRAACALERDRTEDNAFGLLAFEAHAAKALGDESALSDALTAVLQTALYAIESLNTRGVMAALSRALDAAEGTDMASPLRAKALAAGLMPDEILRADRMAREQVSGLEFFEVTLRQTLDVEAWQTYPARLSGQGDWTAFDVTYGVLAADERQAKRAVLQLHSAAPGTAPEVLRCEGNGGDYKDHPGVTYQSYFRPAVPEKETPEKETPHG